MAKCELCGEPMPVGEEMFKYHGYSGPYPAKPGPVYLMNPIEGPSEELAPIFQPRKTRRDLEGTRRLAVNKQGLMILD